MILYNIIHIINVIYTCHTCCTCYTCYTYQDIHSTHTIHMIDNIHSIQSNRIRHSKRTLANRQAYYTYMHDNACIITFPGVRRIAWYGMTLQWNELPSMALKYGPCMMISVPFSLFSLIWQVCYSMFLLADDPRKLPVDKQDGKKHR